MKLYLVKPVILIALLLTVACTKNVALDSNQIVENKDESYLNIGDELKISFYIDDRVDSHDYKVTHGDILRVDIPNEKEFSRGSILVMPDGKISLPGVGLINVSGQTIKEITRVLNAKYVEIAGFRNPTVSVELEEGQKRLHNFLQAIFNQSDQGGLRFLVSNNDDIELPYIPPINTTEKSFLEIRHDIRAAYKAEFGNKLIVTVNRDVQFKDSQFYVIGEVKSAGAFPLDRGINIINAVAMAGGFTYRANKDTFDIKKRGRSANSQWVSVDSDTLVMPGDVIRINERYF